MQKSLLRDILSHLLTSWFGMINPEGPNSIPLLQKKNQENEKKGICSHYNVGANFLTQSLRPLFLGF